MFTDLYEDIYGYDFDSDLEARLDVPFVPSDEKVVGKMLEMSGVNENDVLFDLGCGDGRIVVAAAKEYGARGVGVDMDPRRLEEAREYAEWTGVSPMVVFLEEDLLSVDISQATVVSLYLLPTINLELRPRLLNELRPGTRIVSHAFDMAEWKADSQAAVWDTRLYLWIVPASVAGTWQWQTEGGQNYRVELKQKYQKVSGRAWIDDRPATLKSAQLRGTRLRLAIQPNKNSPAQIFASHVGDDGLLPAPGSSQVGPAVKLA